MKTKVCSICGRSVGETVHTQDAWKNDYFSKVRNGKEIVICVDCIKKISKSVVEHKMNKK